VYTAGDMVRVKFHFSSREMIGIIISVDTNENARLKYFILMRGLNRILWFMESEIIGYV
jgi:hypothetical protein